MGDALSTRSAAGEAGARPGLIAGGATWTWGQLAAASARAESVLQLRALPTDATVAMVGSNSVSTLLAMLACIDTGRSFVPIHPRWTDVERAALVADAQPSLAIDATDVPELSMHPETAARLRASDTKFADVPIADDAILATLYTSGTSGRPRGALLERRAFVASAAGSAANLGWHDDDRWLLCLPLCHIGGLSIVTRALLARRCIVLEPRFEPDAVLDSIRRHRATLLSVVPTMLRDLLSRDEDRTLSTLRAVLVGGAAMSPALRDECDARGIRALATYGLTEACSQVTVQSCSTARATRNGCGRPIAGVELRIGGPTGVALAAGVTGRVLVRGPTMMRGYRDATGWAASAVRDGAREWFDTGDLGEFSDDGELIVHARRSDLIVTGGENVYPAEVEQFVEARAGVRECFVFGLDDERWGQRVAMAVVVAPNHDAQSVLREVKRAMGARLARFKHPRDVAVVPELPRRSNGKIDRGRARAQFATDVRAWE